MAKPSQWDKMRNVLNGQRNGKMLTDEAIIEISYILDVEIETNSPSELVETPKKAKPDIQRGTVFTTRFGGKCVAMSEPDKDGRFWMFSKNGSKMMEYVSNVMKVHKKESKRMIRVISDMPDNPAAWYNQPIFTGSGE